MDIFDKIKVYKFEEVVVCKVIMFLFEVEDCVCIVLLICGFYNSLMDVFCDGYGLIVEIKKVSLFKGLICFDFNLFELVKVY